MAMRSKSDKEAKMNLDQLKVGGVPWGKMMENDGKMMENDGT